MSDFLDRRREEATSLPVLGQVPGFEGATGWLNTGSSDLTDLRGKVVLVDFCTYTCINWLRTLGYVRAWAAKYADHGLVVIGVHTPEFPFEAEVDNVGHAVADLSVQYPVALDSNYAIWNAFRNRYWPAVYIADMQGRIRHSQFGEGGYEECERILQLLLAENGIDDPGTDMVSVADEGFAAQADWANLGSPETYLGYEQGQNLVSPIDEPHHYVLRDELRLNEWALSGNWTVGRGSTVLNGTDGGIRFRFHARDVNLVLSPMVRGGSVPFHVHLDGIPPGDAHGLDTDAQGSGTVHQPRLYQLIRRPGPITDCTFEIVFHSPGVAAWVFTFG